MNTELLIENTFSISPRDILQNLHYIQRSGFEENKGRPNINCWLEDPADTSKVFISASGRDPQMLNLEWVDITYGKRAYFQCSCGLRVSKLYLPIHGNLFKCRKCYKLQYFLTTFNKNSIAGINLYKMNRFQKLADSRANMGRILYKGEYTGRFKRFLGLCDKAGFNTVVQGANDLMTLIKG